MCASARRSSRPPPRLRKEADQWLKLQHHGLERAIRCRAAAFLIAIAGAGAGLQFRAGEALAASPVGRTGFEPTIWYCIDGDGIVTVNIIRAEMGQHVGTALARILADELEADWARCAIDAVDTDPKWGLMVTGGSWSVWQTFPLFSHAGAAGRIALIEEGAKLLGVPASNAWRATARSSPASRSVSFGEIVKRGSLRRTFTPDELAQVADQAGRGASADRRNTDGARHPGEDQRHGALWHRRQGRRHGLCAARNCRRRAMVRSVRLDRR